MSRAADTARRDGASQRAEPSKAGHMAPIATPQEPLQLALPSGFLKAHWEVFAATDHQGLMSLAFWCTGDPLLARADTILLSLIHI